jgi:hypothetical protein
MDTAAFSMAAMSVVHTLYDALVSINVPDEKAKAVIDAMEREMMDKLATKADLAVLHAEFNGEIRLVRQELATVRDSLTKDLQHQTNTLTLRLLLTAIGLVPAIVAAQKFF